MKLLGANWIVPAGIFFLAAASALAQQPGTQTPSRRAPVEGPAQPQARTSEGNGGRVFGNNCRSCHGNAQVPQAPAPAMLKRLPPETIYQALTTGEMKTQAQHLSDQDKRDIAEFLAGRRLGAAAAGDIKAMSNACSSNPPIRSLNSLPAWNGWGVDLSNTRFEPAKAADLSPEQVSNLKLKWAFGLPGASSVYGQPTIVDGRVFITSDSGYVYALDQNTGCVHWAFLAQSGIRSAITIGPIKAGSEKFAAFFGDVHGNTYAVDASNGELLWKVSIDPHPLSRITAGPKLYDGRLYVPVASLEEVESASADYPCCTFRGMMVALDADTGHQIWKTYTIADAPKILRKNNLGINVYGPSGAGVWSSPTIDPKRHAIYIVTGNAFSEPPTDTSDALLALDMNTGKILWSVQATQKDIWHGNCGRGIGMGRHAPPKRYSAEPPYPPENCPDDGGPDQDFSGGVILKTLPNGQDLLVAGQKPGIIWGFDPDRKGAIVWKTSIARAKGNAGVIFGGAADNQNAYFALRSGGISAVQLTTGKEIWYTPTPPPADMAQHNGNSAAVSLIPGVVFSGSLDGMLRAFSATDGHLLWEYNTDQDFKTINGIAARGGSMGAPGPTIANGMLFVGSGYIGFQNGVPGNVLLAFAPGT